MLTYNEQGHPDWHVGGWRLDKEDRQSLAKFSYRPWRDRIQKVYGYPEELAPQVWHRVENQGQQGACQGHANTSGAEFCYRIALQSLDPVLQFSRQAAYIWTQEIDGIKGDSGSTIDGGAKMGKTRGYPLESLWQYTGRYVTRPTGDYQAVINDAKGRLLRTTAVMTSYDDVFLFLSSGLGAVEIGITWNGSMNHAVVETYDWVARGGGHALVFLGWSKKRDKKGRPYLWLANSWGTSWGNKGYAEVSPQAVTEMFKSRYTVMIGLSDMYGPQIRPRPYNFITNSYKSRYLAS